MLHHLSAGILLVSFALALTILIAARKFSNKKLPYLLAVPAIAWAILIPVLYIISSGYLDAVEPSLTAVANYWFRGHDLYHSPDSANIYSMAYGPLPFVLNGIFQKLIPINIIWASKVPGVLAFFAAIIFFEQALVRKVSKQDTLLLYLPLFLVATLGFENMGFWSRPESYLLMLTSIAVFYFSKEHSMLSMILSFGTILGFGLASKIYAPVILFPVAMLHFERQEKKSFLRMTTVLFAGTVFAGLIFAIFLNLPFVSAKNFFYWLSYVGNEPYDMETFINSILISALILGVLGFYRAHKRFPWTFAFTALSLVILSIFSAKVGSHSHYLLPIVPFIVIFFASVREGSFLKKFTAYPLYALLIAFSVCAVKSQFQIVKFLGQRSLHAEQAKEVEFLLANSLGTSAFGFSNYEHYTLNFFSPLVVAQNGRPFVDRSLLWDIGIRGAPMPVATMETLSNCEIQNFFIPKEGEPWSSVEFYKGDEHRFMFNYEWRNRFFAQYRKTFETKHFSVYTCSHL